MKVTEINSQKFKLPSESERATAKAKMEKMRKEGEKMMKGMFEFPDAQGGWLEFSYRYFPGEPIRTVYITHGEIVDIPQILVKHLNNCYKKVRVMDPNATAKLDTGGKATYPTIIQKTSRTRFIPLDVL